MIFLGILFIIFQFLDLITTNVAIKNGCQEANPLLKKTLDGSGFPFSLAVVKIGLGIFLTITLALQSIILNWIVLILDVILGLVVVNNLIRIPIQRKYNRIFTLESATLMKFIQIWDVRQWVASVQKVHLKRRLMHQKSKRRAFTQVHLVRDWIRRFYYIT
ncbi:MAG: DUF5658 family protein [Promethearchaeota archaeon]